MDKLNILKKNRIRGAACIFFKENIDQRGDIKKCKGYIKING